MVDMVTGKIKLQLNDEHVIFSVYHSIKKPKEIHMIYITEIINEDLLVTSINERFGVEALATIIMNFEGDNI